MAWTFSHATAQTSDTYDPSAAITIPATSVGNTLVVVICCDVGNRTVSSISGGATWAAGAEKHRLNANGNNLPGSINVWADICTTSVTSITVTMSGSSGGLDSLTVLELSGGVDPCAEDGTSTETNNTGTVTTHAAGTVTPTVSEVLFVAAAGFGNDTGSWTEDSLFTTVLTPGAPVYSSVAYRIQSNTTAHGYSATSANAVTSGIVLVALKGVTGGGLDLAVSLGEPVIGGSLF